MLASSNHTNGIEYLPCIITLCTNIYTHQKRLATLDGEIVDTEIVVKLELRDVLKVHAVQT